MRLSASQLLLLHTIAYLQRQRVDVRLGLAVRKPRVHARQDFVRARIQRLLGLDALGVQRLLGRVHGLRGRLEALVLGRLERLAQLGLLAPQLGLLAAVGLRVRVSDGWSDAETE